MRSFERVIALFDPDISSNSLYNSSYISNVNYNLSFPKDEGY
jgi:hypothetical protein